MKIDDLTNDLMAGKVIPVIGAGVSMQTANIPNWYGALHSALDHAISTGCASDTETIEIKDLIDKGNLVIAAKKIKDLLGAPYGEYPSWLKSIFEINENANLSLNLIRSIENLLCPFIATTNYDRLLSKIILSRPNSITWREPLLMQSTIREGGNITSFTRCLYGSSFGNIWN